MFPSHVTSLDMFLVERRSTLDFSSTRTYVAFSALLRASRTIPFVPSLIFPCFDFACLPHVLTRSYVYRTPCRTYSYIRNSPVYRRLQD